MGEEDAEALKTEGRPAAPTLSLKRATGAWSGTTATPKDAEPTATAGWARTPPTREIGVTVLEALAM